MTEQMTLEQVRSGLQKLFNAGSGVACSAFPLAHWIRAIDAHLAQHAAMVAMLRELAYDWTHSTLIKSSSEWMVHEHANAVNNILNASLSEPVKE